MKRIQKLTVAGASISLQTLRIFFFFFLVAIKKAVENLLKGERKLKDFSEGNFSQAMLRLLETPKIQVRRLLTKDKIKCLGHHNWQLWFWN